MEENKLDKSELDNNSINGVPMEAIDKLNDEQLQAVIDGKNAVDRNKLEAGKFGEVLGTNIKNASIHIALIICAVLVIFCGLDLVHSFISKQAVNMDIWNLVLPIVTMSLGYIFGKGEEK